MRTASDVFLGTHDFRSFCRRPVGSDASRPLVRRVTTARWHVDEGPEASDADGGTGETRLLRFEITAGSFCHQMVRSLVGSLVEVGRGRENAAGLMERLRAVSRHRMPDPAPALGLCLVSVSY
jgi:tRNA pseudouridine38-40 synthase